MKALERTCKKDFLNNSSVESFKFVKFQEKLRFFALPCSEALSSKKLKGTKVETRPFERRWDCGVIFQRRSKLHMFSITSHDAPIL